MDKQKEIATMQMIAAEMPCPFDCINDCFRDTTHGFCAGRGFVNFLQKKATVMCARRSRTLRNVLKQQFYVSLLII